MKPLDRSLLSLDGVSLGDSFGQTFFDAESAAVQRISSQTLPDAPWYITDDSIMASAVHSTLALHGHIDQSELLSQFVRLYELDRSRGYGATMARMLRLVADGSDWREVSGNAFDGMGSFGNGAAMRVAPVGAYFAGDDQKIVEQARLSAEVTHANIEGIAGAIAVAIACGRAALNSAKRHDSPEVFLAHVAEHTPRSITRDRILQAAELPMSYDVRTAVTVLGNGVNLSSQDTVPFSLWCAARHIDNFTSAMWTTVSGLGDRDTTCAIAGAVVSLAVGTDNLPSEWLSRREGLARWLGH